MKQLVLLAAGASLFTSCGLLAPQSRSIADIVAADANFSTLRQALNAAGLTDTLRSGSYTVFAPTNAAFAKLPAGTVETLLRPDNKQQLTNILLYHVVSGSVPASTVVTLNGQSVPTLLTGKSVRISVTGSTVKVNDATVTATDIRARNGIIHVIDTVLLPPQ